VRALRAPEAGGLSPAPSCGKRVALGGPFVLELVFGVGSADPTKGTTMQPLGHAPTPL